MKIDLFQFYLYTLFTQKGKFMKLFLTAILLTFVIKGVTYILFHKQVKFCAQKLMEISSLQLILFGWILILGALAGWLGYVRNLNY